MHTPSRVHDLPSACPRDPGRTMCRCQSPTRPYPLAPPSRAFCLALHALVWLLLSAHVPSAAAEGLVFVASSVFARVEQGLTDPAVDVSVMTLSMLPLLAWGNDRFREAVQFRVSRFDTAPDAPPFGPLLREMPQAQHLSQPLTVVQVHGAMALGTHNYGVLRYALYAGVFAEEIPRDLVGGVSISYAVGPTEFTLGIGFLYGPHVVGLDVVGSPDIEGRGAWPGRNISELIQRLADKDRLLRENLIVYGAVTHERAPWAVRTRVVLSLTPHWAMYHRLDRLSLGQGLPKITEHSLGVRFLPGTNVSLHVEVIIGGLDDAMGETRGVRFAGTFYF